MNLVAARLHTLLAAPSGPFRPGPVTLDGHPVRLLAQPSMLPGNPLRWRFECPGCGRNCTLLRRPKDGDPRPRAYIHSPWRCRLCLHEPRRWRLAKAATVAKAEEALAALMSTGRPTGTAWRPSAWPWRR